MDKRKQRLLKLTKSFPINSQDPTKNLNEAAAHAIKQRLLELKVNQSMVDVQLQHVARVYTDVLRVEDESLLKTVKCGKKSKRVPSEKGDFFRREAEFNEVGSHI